MLKFNHLRFQNLIFFQPRQFQVNIQLTHGMHQSIVDDNSPTRCFTQDTGNIRLVRTETISLQSTKNKYKNSKSKARAFHCLAALLGSYLSPATMQDPAFFGKIKASPQKGC